MPRRQEAVHSEIKRLSLYAGNTVSDEIVNQLGMRYAIDSPTIARMTLAQSAAKESKRRAKANKGQRYTRRLLVAALVLQDINIFTLPLGLKMFQSNMSTQWGLYAAGALLVSIPVVLLFLILSRYLISGMSSGAVKG